MFILNVDFNIDFIERGWKHSMPVRLNLSQLYFEPIDKSTAESSLIWIAR